MKIETDRLYLRPFATDEFDLFYALLSNKAVMRYSLAGPLSKERSKELFEQFNKLQKDRGFSPWAVFTKEANVFVGLCGIQEFEIEAKRELEVTFRLLPEHWGSGYGAEAARECYQYAFDAIGSDVVFSAIEPSNTHALRVAKASGLEKLSSATIHGKEVFFFAKRKSQKN
ncbi:GNAT family N-acetyltransferase [Puniceicoccaceae bacterium K14]|nr:GNAT family N-acetyltransferase [Puniceicoccaceae bacterium K14]